MRSTNYCILTLDGQDVFPMEAYLINVLSDEQWTQINLNVCVTSVTLPECSIEFSFSLKSADVHAMMQYAQLCALLRTTVVRILILNNNLVKIIFTL